MLLKKFKTEKKNENSLKDESADRSIEMPEYAPNMYLSPLPYMPTQEFIELEENFKEFCEDHFKKVNPDEFNGSLLDADIERITETAIENIRNQRICHIRTIMQHIKSIHKADLIKIERKMEMFKADKISVENDLKKKKKIVYGGTNLAEEV